MANSRREIVDPLLARLQNGPQLIDILSPLGCDQSELGEMSAQRIDHLRPLPDQQIPQPENHAETLLLWRLYFDKTHSRPTARLRNSLCIRHVVFLALHIRLDELRG